MRRQEQAQQKVQQPSGTRRHSLLGHHCQHWLRCCLHADMVEGRIPGAGFWGLGVATKGFDVASKVFM
jgi:hypothetical protein